MSETLKTAEPSKEACKAATRENSLYAAYAIDVAPLIAEREALKKERDEWKEQAHITRGMAQHVEMLLGRGDTALRNIGMSLGSSDEWTDQATMIADVEGRVARFTRENAAMREALKKARVCVTTWSPCPDEPLADIDAALAQLTPEQQSAALNAGPENVGAGDADALAEARATIAEAVEIMRPFADLTKRGVVSVLVDEAPLGVVGCKPPYNDLFVRDFCAANAFIEKHGARNGGEERCLR